MQSFNDSSPQIKAPLGDSSLEDWASFLENYPGGTMRPLFRASPLERISAYLRTPRGLAALSIWWVLFLLGLVFVFTPRMSWGIYQKASTASSMVVLPSERSSAGWTTRRLYCSHSQPCDVWNPFSVESPFNLRFEIQPEEVKYAA